MNHDKIYNSQYGKNYEYNSIASFGSEPGYNNFQNNYQPSPPRSYPPGIPPPNDRLPPIPDEKGYSNYERDQYASNDGLASNENSYRNSPGNFRENGPSYRNSPQTIVSPYRNQPNSSYRNSPHDLDGSFRNSPHDLDGSFRNSPHDLDGSFRNSPHDLDGSFRNSPNGTFRNSPQKRDLHYNRNSPSHIDSPYRDNNYRDIPNSYRKSPQMDMGKNAYSEPPYSEPSSSYRNSPQKNVDINYNRNFRNSPNSYRNTDMPYRNSPHDMDIESDFRPILHAMDVPKGNYRDLQKSVSPRKLRNRTSPKPHNTGYSSTEKKDFKTQVSKIILSRMQQYVKQGKIQLTKDDFKKEARKLTHIVVEGERDNGDFVMVDRKKMKIKKLVDNNLLR
eukprot:TRINITY_DN2007_c1_g1_i1.p1 TRINITY_DN2007_c1_g1~~TRINITY_DN2007_c1_g1_i1.p1  ORF type:complete len:453 (-),score=101.77 TRINITY_DN2007_c1_g1_i1:63-1232(-)